MLSGEVTVSDLTNQFRSSTDENVKKYITRLRQKLKQQSIC